MPHDLIPKNSPPKTETSQLHQLPIKCKDIGDCTLTQEHQAKEKPNSIKIQTPDTRQKESKPALESKELEASRRVSQAKMKELGKDVRAAMLEDNAPEGQRNRSFAEHSQQLDMLRTYVVLVAEEAAQVESAENISSLSWLEDECMQVNGLLKRIMPSIALEPELMKKWSEIFRELADCWDCVRSLSLKRKDRGQYTICRFIKDLLVTKYNITNLSGVKSRFPRMADWVLNAAKEQKMPSRNKGRITVNQSYLKNLLMLRSKLGGY
eukprot:TRINITY_DN1056_c0_g1_i5.p1 TRINITY_DN1056_c0_g1~~TRINITY_DN1056_c0_g1_i5.p1  ORF type:complete len:266 (+),score=41.30 TRINITY_DN1056_c0_g1_i5:924-1721(+)